ncbi:MAG: hypothetical protein NVS2B8_13370 [Vulcanimicrobiaceae bacterium]
MRENVEDDHRPVDDRQRNCSLEIRALTRTQVVKNEDLRRAERLRDLGDLAGLAAADEGARIDAIEPLHHAADERGACSDDERFVFGEFGLERTVRIAQVDGDDEAALARRDREVDGATARHVRAIEAGAQRDEPRASRGVRAGRACPPAWAFATDRRSEATPDP